jgi:hypothetical protein
MIVNLGDKCLSISEVVLGQIESLQIYDPTSW